MPKCAVNQSSTTGFIILGFSEYHGSKTILFLIFLVMYLLTVFSNILIISLVFLDNHLQKPMYYFICNMSIIDVFYSTVTSPNLLQLILKDCREISFQGCMTQLYFFNSFISMEYMLLTSMAYDRYVAICQPLSYQAIINKRKCLILSSIVCGAGFLACAPISVLVSGLSFCMSIEINHFFCDLAPLLKLACDDTLPIEYVAAAEGVLITLNCFLLTLISYIYIILSILKIGSREGRYKAFSTCASHLLLFILFYLLIFCTYLKPSSHSVYQGKILSLLYVNIIPMLNPLIYSLRNKAVKEAFRKCIQCKFCK